MPAGPNPHHFQRSRTNTREIITPPSGGGAPCPPLSEIETQTSLQNMDVWMQGEGVGDITVTNMYVGNSGYNAFTAPSYVLNDLTPNYGYYPLLINLNIGTRFKFDFSWSYMGFNPQVYVYIVDEINNTQIFGQLFNSNFGTVDFTSSAPITNARYGIGFARGCQRADCGDWEIDTVAFAEYDPPNVPVYDPPNCMKYPAMRSCSIIGMQDVPPPVVVSPEFDPCPDPVEREDRHWNSLVEFHYPSTLSEGAILLNIVPLDSDFLIPSENIVAGTGWTDYEARDINDTDPSISFQLQSGSRIRNLIVTVTDKITNTVVSTHMLSPGDSFAYAAPNTGCWWYSVDFSEPVT